MVSVVSTASGEYRTYYSGTSINTWTLRIKDTIEITSLQRTLSKAPKIDFPIVLIHFPPLKSGQPLYSGQISLSQCVFYKEVPLYVILYRCYVSNNHLSS